MKISQFKKERNPLTFPLSSSTQLLPPRAPSRAPPGSAAARRLDPPRGRRARRLDPRPRLARRRALLAQLSRARVAWIQRERERLCWGWEIEWVNFWYGCRSSSGKRIKGKWIFWERKREKIGRWINFLFCFSLYTHLVYYYIYSKLPLGLPLILKYSKMMPPQYHSQIQ